MSFAFNVNVLLPVLAKQTLDAGPATFGIITACFGAGALVGALVSAALVHARWRVMIAAVAVFGAGRAADRPARTTSSSSARCSSSAASASPPTRRTRTRLGAARDARPHPRPRARHLLLRLDGAAAAREPADRLALRRSAAPSSRSRSAASARWPPPPRPPSRSGARRPDRPRARPASSPTRCRSDRHARPGSIADRAAARSLDSPDVVLLVTGVVACTSRSPTPRRAANAPVDGGGPLRG